MRVLLVEDYSPLRESLAQALREAGYAVDAAADGEEGAWFATTGEYDVIVLDIVLPGRDGLAILHSLRKAGRKSPVLLLTAKDTVQERVTGLNAGADDYLVKPFALDELLARVRALTRRKFQAAQPVIRVQDLEVDTVGRTVRRAGRRIELTAREFGLLELLAQRAGRIVSRSEISEHLYDFRSEIESNVIDVYIGYLRRKLDAPHSAQLIHTRRGQGYILE